MCGHTVQGPEIEYLVLIILNDEWQVDKTFTGLSPCLYSNGAKKLQQVFIIDKPVLVPSGTTLIQVKDEV